MMATVFGGTHGVLLVDFTPRSATINDGHQGTLIGLTEDVRRKRRWHREYNCCTIMPGHTLLAQHHNKPSEHLGLRYSFSFFVQSWSGTTGLPTAPQIEARSRIYASKLMKMSRRRSSDGYVCRAHHLTTKALTLWSTAVINASTDTATASKNRLLMCLYLTNLLPTVTCLYPQQKKQKTLLASPRTSLSWSSVHFTHM
jgi:hypothetical protein